MVENTNAHSLKYSVGVRTSGLVTGWMEGLQTRIKCHGEIEMWYQYLQTCCIKWMDGGVTDLVVLNGWMDR